MSLFLFGVIVTMVVMHWSHKTPAQKRRAVRNAHRVVFGAPARSTRRTRRTRP